MGFYLTIAAVSGDTVPTSAELEERILSVPTMWCMKHRSRCVEIDRPGRPRGCAPLRSRPAFGTLQPAQMGSQVAASTGSSRMCFGRPIWR